MIFRILHGAAWVIALALFFFMIFVTFTGCKGPEHHYAKFIKKGGKIHCDTVTINRVDTLIIEGDTFIVNRPVTVIEKQIEYVTRWETKYRYKTIKDSNETIRYVTKWKTKEVIKTERIENRSLWWLWLLGGAGAAFAVQRVFKSFWPVRWPRS